MNDGRSHALTRIYLEGFTAFARLELELNPGINVFLGSNGTGKTHLLKVAYTACEYLSRKFAHSPIAEAFTSLYDREIERSLGSR